MMIRLAPSLTCQVLALTENIERHIVLVRHRLDRDRPTIRAATAAVKEAVNSLDRAENLV
jgi:hypothetical protein